MNMLALSARTAHRNKESRNQTEGNRQLRKEIKRWMNSGDVETMHFGCLMQALNGRLDTDTARVRRLLDRIGRGKLSTQAFDYMEKQLLKIESCKKGE